MTTIEPLKIAVKIVSSVAETLILRRVLLAVAHHRRGLCILMTLRDVSDGAWLLYFQAVG